MLQISWEKKHRHIHTVHKTRTDSLTHTQQILISQVLLNKSGVGNSGIAELFSVCAMNDANGINTLDIDLAHMQQSYTKYTQILRTFYPLPSRTLRDQKNSCTKVSHHTIPKLKLIAKHFDLQTSNWGYNELCLCGFVPFSVINSADVQLLTLECKHPINSWIERFLQCQTP